MQTDLYAITNFYQRHDTSILNALYKLLEADDKVTINKIVLDNYNGFISELYYKLTFTNIYGTKDLYIILTTNYNGTSFTVRFAQGFDETQPANRQPGGTWSDGDGTDYYWSLPLGNFWHSSENFIANKGYFESVQYEVSDQMSGFFYNNIIHITRSSGYSASWYFPAAIFFNNNFIITSFQPAGTNEIGILILANWTSYNLINRKALVLFNGEWYSETSYDNEVFYKRTVTPYNLLSDYSTSSASIASSPLILKGTFTDNSNGSTKTFHMGHTDLHFTIFHNEKASQIGGGCSNMLPQRARNFIYYYGPKKYHIASTWFKKTDGSINDYSVKITEPAIHQVEYQYF